MLAEQLEFEFAFACPAVEAEYYREGAQDLIRKIVPEELLKEDSRNLSSQRAQFARMLPLVVWSDLSKGPCVLSILLLCRYRLRACHFFYELISRWLVPEKKVNVELFFSSDVRLPHIFDDVLSVAEIVVELKSTQEVEAVRRNLSVIESELRLGVVSDYHARRILEFKGLSLDGKTAMIQEKITSLIQSRSKDFDRGIFSQMQQFLVRCSEEFKSHRDYHHISRIISNLYSLRNLLSQNIQSAPSKRHILLKLLKTKLEGSRFVLGILVSLNFLKEHEIFDIVHLSNAIQVFLPSVRVVHHSPFIERDTEAFVQTIYLEIEKTTQEDFSFEEIQKLRADLPDQIKGHIEQLAHPIFMPRNEEEVLRNIMALSYQLRFVNDLPQVVISFDEQRDGCLYFTVILLRVLRDEDLGIQTLLDQHKKHVLYLPDRVRRVGQLRRKYFKEATVFRAAVRDEKFLREDCSVDTYKAREEVFSDLTRILGELRDYNGGMLHKQKMLLARLKESLKRVGICHSMLLEDFFFSLRPIEMRTTLDIEPLKQLFLLFLQTKKMEIIQKKEEEGRSLVCLPLKNRQDEIIYQKLAELSIPPHQLVSFQLQDEEGTFAGFLLLSGEKKDQRRFLEIF